VTQEIETVLPPGRPFRLGDWLVEPPLNRLSKGDTATQLELKVMDVLVCLAERAGEVVTRQEIIDKVWATEFISDNTLTHAVTELRNALGDDARNPSFIETIHRRGYRLIAAVEPSVSDDEGESKVARFPVPERLVSAGEGRSPYPGLAAFTEDDAEFFFGREDEVAKMWRKLTSRRLLALIGPSGVGKSSFLRAGVIPVKPYGWGVVVCQPGEAPFAALARALVPEFEGDSEAISKLVYLGDSGETVAMVSRWRQQRDQALLIVDQFEELFTLNPSETQAMFADLLRRVVDEADVHVLLSMRDDFLFHTHDHPSLGPILDDLTLLGAPSPDSLLLALVEPARRLGFTFESDELLDEMIAEVEGERGALPLLAFAVSRLWEKRNRKQKLLTRQAYADIGGVGGALARHAEETLKSIGEDRLPIVREVFRNLVTAQGTRAIRSVDDLLSVFSSDRHGDATAVLNRLIDARLLTSFEEDGIEGAPRRHRVEVVHESLLSSWPRLVGWQTQDADSARLRDELRQAARIWKDHGRARDYLWTGKAYREFSVWRENYPGGLTEREEAFATAMTAQAKRRKRRRRTAVAALIAALLAGLAIVGSFWQSSVREARRAEAANLLSMAQLELESYPSAAVAYATASLELSDTTAARRLALRALWKGPTAFVASEGYSTLLEFSPDGKWLVQETGPPNYRLHVIGADGTDELLDDLYDQYYGLWMDSESGLFSTGWGNPGPWALWSAPEKRVLAKARHELPVENRDVLAFDVRRQRMLLGVLEGDRAFVDALGFDGSSKRLGELPYDHRTGAWCENAPGGEWFAVANGQGVFVIEIGDHDLSEPRRLEHTKGQPVDIECDPLGRFVAAGYENGQIRLLHLDGASPATVIQGPSGITGVRITKDGSLLEAIKSENDGVETWVWRVDNEKPTLLGQKSLGKSRGWPWPDWELNAVESQIVSILNPDGKIRLWPLRAPADAEPVIMRRDDLRTPRFLAIRPQGQWVAASGDFGLMLWPVERPYPIVIKRYEEKVLNLVFDPEGRWFATSSIDGSGTVRLWQLHGTALPPARIVYEAQTHAYDIAASPDGEHLLLGTHSGVKLLSLSGEAPVDLPGFVKTSFYVAFSPDGRFAAASGSAEDAISQVIRVWDLASKEEVMVIEPGERGVFPFIRFTEDGHLLVGNLAGLLRWNLQTGDSETLFEDRVGEFAMSSDESRVLLAQWGGQGTIYGPLASLDLGTGLTTPLASHGDCVIVVDTDAGGTIAVTGDQDGIIRVGPITGEEPHLLLGSPDQIADVAVDPQGRWIASASGTEVRLWPMPDLSKPPLHTLPHDELVAKLKTLTNLRVVRDEESPTGWKLTHDPFPGWETVPGW